MTRTTQYDQLPGVHQVHTPAHQRISTGAGWVLGAIFVAMAAVGIGGAIATFFNMKRLLGEGWIALGVVLAGEGATAVLGLALVGLTMITRPYPTGLRFGLWLIPLVGSVTGASIAAVRDDYQHALVNGITPLAMTVAAEMAGYLARSIVVHAKGIDAEADRRTGETLRRIEYHQARARRHPSARVQARSQRAAWRLARRLGEGDPRLGQRLPAAYADRTADSALSALDELYGRTPQQPAELPAAQEAVTIPAAVEPPTDPAAEQVEVVTATYATDWVKNGSGSWQSDPSIYAASYQEAELVEDEAAAQPQAEQPELPAVDRWLQAVPAQEVHTPVHPEVHPTDQADDDSEEEPAEDGVTPEQRRKIIVAHLAAGESLRQVALAAGCSQTYVRKVRDEETAA